jgi:hypothetical protein
MPDHCYRIGQRVRLSAAAINRSAGVYTVTALLPETGGEWQYRLQHAMSSQQRVAREGQLSSIANPEAGHDRPPD